MAVLVFALRSKDCAQELGIEEHGRGIENERIDAVENAPVAWDDAARVLHLVGALEHRLAQVANRSDDASEHADDQAVRYGQGVEKGRLRHEHAGDRTRHPAGETLPGLVWAHRGKELSLSKKTPDEIGRGVVAPGRDQSAKDPLQPIGAVPEPGKGGEAERPEEESADQLGGGGDRGLQMSQQKLITP